LPSITEIEELIVQLHNEGKTMREIAKVVHKNFTYIGAILRRRFPEEFIDNTKSNKETKALKLFYEKKSPTQIAIELRSSAAETDLFIRSVSDSSFIFSKIFADFLPVEDDIIYFVKVFQDAKVKMFC
jgi:hypothetical protein